MTQSYSSVSSPYFKSLVFDKLLSVLDFVSKQSAKTNNKLISEMYNDITHTHHTDTLTVRSEYLCEWKQHCEFCLLFHL